MTDFLVSHSKDLLGVISLSAVISWILVKHSKHKPKTIGIVLGVTLILFLPLAFHYEYVLPYTYHILCVAGLSCTCFLITTLLDNYKVIKTLILTALTSAAVIFFLMLSVVSYLNYLVEDKCTYQEPSKVYSDGKYMIRYRQIPGTGNTCYELREFSVIPVMTKHLETTAYYKNTCEFSFDHSRFIYNSCMNKLMSFETYKY